MKEAVDLAVEALIKPFEGYHKKLPDGSCMSYPDPASPLGRGKFSKEEIQRMTPGQLIQAGNPWTIGYGSTGPDIKPDTVWSEYEAVARLTSDVYKFGLGAVGLSPGLKDALPRQFAGIISFCYNCGLGNYKISTLRRRVNEGDWLSAQEEILKWNKAGGRVMAGLTRRRTAESLMLVP